MKKLIYVLLALFIFACNNEDDVFNEENNKCFHSLEEYNAFVQSAIQTYSIRETKSADKEIVSFSVIDCIKKAAINKGIPFEIKYNGENNEMILFGSEDPNIQYATTSCQHVLWHDNNLPNGGNIELIVGCTFTYHILTHKIIEICHVGEEVKVPSYCPYLRRIEDLFFIYQIDESQTAIFYTWTGAMTMYNYITKQDERKVYYVGGSITVAPNK